MYTKGRIILIYLFAMFSLVMVAEVTPLSAQALLPPFVRKPKMTVISPEASLADLSNIDGFAHLAKSGGKVFATFKANSKQLGILVCDGKSLKVEQVYWLENDKHDISAGEWCGLVSLDSDRVAALCWQSGPDGRDKPIRGYLVTYSPTESQNWITKSIELPEKPTVLAYLPQANALAGITEPSNYFFLYDLSTAKIQVQQTIFDFVPYAYPSGRCLYPSSEGGLYGSYKGRLFCYAHDSSFFEYLGPLPCQYGHLSVTALSAMAANGNGTLVGGTSKDGYLFTVDCESRKISSWGKPTDGTEILKIVHAGQSGFWGIAQTPAQSCRLFHFQPEKGLLEDLGVPAGILKAQSRTWIWHAFQIADMLVLDDGRIVMAESSRQAKLLVFDPERSSK